MTIRIEEVVVGQLDVNCYVVAGGGSPDAVVIDPGDEAERIMAAVTAAGLVPRHIVCTHAHYDHVCALREMKDAYGASLVMHRDDADTYLRTRDLCVTWGYEPDDFPAPDITVADGDRITAGGLVLEVIHTPGHTPGSICLLGEGVVFTGDTLFRGSVGRTDLPGGSTERLMASLKRLTALPPETRVLCGHGTETTIGLEKERNPFLNSRSGLRFFG